MNPVIVKLKVSKWLLARKCDWASPGLLPPKQAQIGLPRFVKLLLWIVGTGISIEFGLYLLLVIFRVFPNWHHFFDLHPPKETFSASVIGFLLDNGRWYVHVFLWDSAMLLCSLTYLLTMFWNFRAGKIAKAKASLTYSSINDVWPPAPQ